MASAHGKEKSSGDQSVMTVSTEELENIITGFALSESNENETPEVILQRMLSTRTAISTSSSHAERMRRAQEQTAQQNFTRIGAEACGEVFQQSGTVNIAKRAKTEQYAQQLWNDYGIHLKVRDAFARRVGLDIDIRIPRVMYFISVDDDEWWNEFGSKFPVESESTPKAVLISERIMPLHKDIRSSLIKKYCPESKQEIALKDPGNADCLMRVYLGAQRPQRKSMFGGFTLRNFLLYVDDADHLGLDASTYAISMAQALALMHWEVKCNARDVEFVLGSAPSTEEDIPQLTPADFDELPPGTSTRQTRLNFKRRTVHLWMIDFNQVETIAMNEAGVLSATKAYMDNDPYFPRPLCSTTTGQKLWTTFKASYLAASERIKSLQEAEGKMVEWKGLPEAFIGEVVDAEQKRLERKAEAMRRSAEK